MAIKQELGKRIKQLRLANGYTQEKFSELINISQRALSRIEKGDNFVTAETLDNILSAFNLTPEELFVTEQFKEPTLLLNSIYQNLEKIKNDSEKLYIVNGLIKHLII